MRASARVPYSEITDHPGLQASGEQTQRILQRYRFAKDCIGGGDVLDLACGSGMGSGYLSDAARSVVAGDLDADNIAVAKGSCAQLVNVRFVRLDAERLPFHDAAFDVVLVFEALYHLSDPEAFVREAARVLRPGGELLLSAVNKDWKDLHPSPNAVRYYSAPEVKTLLSACFQDIRLFAGIPVANEPLRTSLLSHCKAIAVRLGLIPKTLKGRTFLKRLVFGSLKPLPAVIGDALATYSPPTPIPGAVSCREYKVLYAKARRP